MHFDEQSQEDSEAVHCIVKVRHTESRAQIRHAKSKLLVLDSDRQVLQAVCETVKPYFQVIQATDPQWAMAWLGQYRDVTVFLVDDELRQGSGSQLLRRAQAMRPDVLRVLMTRSLDEPRGVQSLRNGSAQKLVEKPMSRDSLLAAVMPQSVEEIDLPHVIVA
jgi:DNA-binding NtrC family response regulator